MTVVGVVMARDEADVIGDTVQAMLDQVDAVIACNNLSTDGTGAILAGLYEANRPRMMLTVDQRFAFHQSAAMTGLARLAIAEFGAEWVVGFDADEVWRPIGGGTLRDALGRVPADRQVAWGHVVDHIATPDDPPGPPVRSMRWREREAKAWRKVCARSYGPLIVGSGQHTASYAAEWTDEPVFLVHHFPYRSPEQMLRKVRQGVAATDADGVPDPQDDPTPHLRELARGTDREIGQRFYAGWWRGRPDPLLYVEDPAVGVPSAT